MTTHLSILILKKPCVLVTPVIRESVQNALEGEPLLVAQTSDSMLSLELADRSIVHVLLVVGPVPDNEAESHVRYSISSFGGRWALPPSGAHVIVSMHDANADMQPLESLIRFTRIVAGLIDGVNEVTAIYSGAAGATHEAAYFRSAALEFDALPVDLWNGVEVSRTGKKAVLVSMGMSQLNLPDLKLRGPISNFNEMLEFFLDLLALISRRGEVIPENHTVGRTPDEKLRVRHETAADGRRLWFVSVP